MALPFAWCILIIIFDPLFQVSKRRKKRDPNEPQKPVSAYALFFRDTQASIKMRNPNANFGEVSKEDIAKKATLTITLKGTFNEYDEF